MYIVLGLCPNENSFGPTMFNARNRTQTEQLVRGKSRVIAVEVK